MYIFRTYITKKDGTRVYARDCGKRAFRIFVYEKPKKEENGPEEYGHALIN